MASYQLKLLSSVWYEEIEGLRIVNNTFSCRGDLLYLSITELSQGNHIQIHSLYLK